MIYDAFYMDTRNDKLGKNDCIVFFDRVESVMQRYRFQPKQIYNMGEAGVTTVPRSEKVIEMKGCKQVGQATSRECGELVTHVGIIYANDNFIKVQTIFRDNVRCTNESPVLLIMANHESRLSIKGLDFCKEKGIVVLTIPPHTSNKLQPLDRCLFGTFEKLVPLLALGLIPTQL